MHDDIVLAKTIDYIDDLCSVIGLLSNINAMNQRTNANNRAIILSQHRKSTAVVFDITNY